MPNQKIFTHICALLILTVGLVTSSVVLAGASTLASIQKSGQLVLGTSANMPPMTGKNEEGKVVGFDIHLARFMADGMGVDLNPAHLGQVFLGCDDLFAEHVVDRE